MWGGDWSTAGQPQLDSQGAQQHESFVTLSRLTLCDPMDPWAVAHQAPLSMGSPRQEYWSGLPFPSPDSATWSDPTDNQAGAVGARLSLRPLLGTPVLSGQGLEGQVLSKELADLTGRAWADNRDDFPVSSPTPRTLCSPLRPLISWSHVGKRRENCSPRGSETK